MIHKWYSRTKNISFLSSRSLRISRLCYRQKKIILRISQMTSVWETRETDFTVLLRAKTILKVHLKLMRENVFSRLQSASPTWFSWRLSLASAELYKSFLHGTRFMDLLPHLLQWSHRKHITQITERSLNAKIIMWIFFLNLCVYIYIYIFFFFFLCMCVFFVKDRKKITQHTDSHRHISFTQITGCTCTTRAFMHLHTFTIDMKKLQCVAFPFM